MLNVNTTVVCFAAALDTLAFSFISGRLAWGMPVRLFADFEAFGFSASVFRRDGR